MGFTWSAFGISLIDCERLSACLKPPKSNFLHTLILKSSQLDDVQTRILCQALLENNGNIKHLDLSNNKIGDAGARGLAKVLASQTTQQSSHNNSNSSGGGGLKKLILSNNRISQIGAHSLGRCFTKNRNLVYLNLRLNKIGDVGGFDFINALSHAYQYTNPQILGKPMLSNLDISGNGLATMALMALCGLIKSNIKCLKSIDVSANSLARPVVANHASGKGKIEGILLLGMAHAEPIEEGGTGLAGGNVLLQQQAPLGISAQAAKEKQELEDAGKLIVDAASKNQVNEFFVWGQSSFHLYAIGVNTIC